MKLALTKEWLGNMLANVGDDPGGLMACSPELYSEMEKSMGQYVITIMGTGCHHNFKTETRDSGNGPAGNYLIPSGDGGYVRTTDGDADALAADLVELLKKHGHHVEHASFTYGGRDLLLKPDYEPEPPAPTE